MGIEEVNDALREAVQQMPYRSISVKHLCERAGISRKTFYQHYDGKLGVLVSVFHAQVVQPELDLCRLLTFAKMSSHACEMERHMFRAVEADDSFYRCLVATPEGAEAFFSAAVRTFRAFDEEMLQQASFTESPVGTDYVVEYFAGAKAHVMLEWVKKGFPIPADDAADLYSRMALPFWRDLI